MHYIDWLRIYYIETLNMLYHHIETLYHAVNSVNMQEELSSICFKYIRCLEN